MWFIGMIVGLLLGAPFGGETAVGGAVLGLVVGALAGVLRRPAEKDVPVATEKRLQLLEQQVAWLHRETERLQGELAMVRKDEVPAEGNRHPAAAPPDAVPEMPTEANA
ncbi:MAG TPA: hypothetical protein PKD04_05650, partial [Rhodocyclaceae bacterium]|nr:hypothetical protein [Rhodocyclaceae bacterium]